MSRVDFGQVEVQLDEAVTLKPTLRAFEKISNRFGGLRNAIQALSNMDIDSVAFIIAAAAGIGQRDMESLKERIFEAGVVKVMPKVTEYLVLLMNPTGKDDEPEEDGAGK